MSALLSRVDHLVYATPHVDSTVDRLEQLFGVRAVVGGSHPAWGTHNALIALGNSSYFEIIGPAPGLSPKVERPFGLNQLAEPRIATWAAKGNDLEHFVNEARERGVELGDVQTSRRLRPDSVELNWTMTDPWRNLRAGIVPFFIDWGDTPHPATTSVNGGELVQMRAVHPQANEVRSVLDELGLELPLETGPMPELIATIRTPRGTVIEIR